MGREGMLRGTEAEPGVGLWVWGQNSDFILKSTEGVGAEMGHNFES